LSSILRIKIGEGEAKALVEFVNTKLTGSFKSKKDGLATKNYIHKLDIKIEQTNSGIFRRMLIFWAGPTGIMFGIPAFFLK
jgi:hypothetical protein